MVAVAPRRRKVITAPRTVIGYHGCSLMVAERILTDGRFQPSTKAYDWLGEGVYFWEYAPYRALEWATLKCEKEGGEPVVVSATIKLGRCLNLLDIEHIPALLSTYESYILSMEQSNLLRNTDRGAHFLDRAIIDAYCRGTRHGNVNSLQTVRGSFAEGAPIYPGSKILKKAHTQIAVRDSACISRLALVHLS